VEELAQRRQVKSALTRVLKERGLDDKDFQDPGVVLRAVLNLLAAGPAFAFLVNLEDLWMETEPQNIPGTNLSRNWTRKARCTFEEFINSAQIAAILREVDQYRKGE
jgi:4-alpha-glucanotransferase